jgi:hypothetical protein
MHMMDMYLIIYIQHNTVVYLTLNLFQNGRIQLLRLEVQVYKFPTIQEDITTVLGAVFGGHKPGPPPPPPPLMEFGGSQTKLQARSVVFTGKLY